MLDKQTYKALFDEYYDALCQYAYSMTKDGMAAEDAVQDVFVGLWKNRQSTSIQTNPKSYLITAVKRKILEHIRNNKLVIVGEVEIYNLETVAKDNIEDKIEHFRIAERIKTSIRQLPSRCSTIFALSKLEGLSNKEIADRLNISVKTVENQMTKAYKLLRQYLKDLI
jgi:RNA polymerase sigma-70 factor (ECF subfamily)